jgi:hypothetical protein
VADLVEAGLVASVEEASAGFAVRPRFRGAAIALM